MISARTLTVALALLLGGCVDRQAELDDLPAEFPGCMAVPAWGHYEDGSSSYILNEWDRTGTVCTCMTQQELIDRVYEAELADEAYHECVRMAELQDFAWTDCETFYEEGQWFGVFAAIDDEAWMNQTGLSCGDDENSEPSCAIADGEPSRAAWTLMMLAGLLVARRRRGNVAASLGAAARPSAQARAAMQATQRAPGQRGSMPAACPSARR